MSQTENTELNQKDLETLAEAILEHIAHFDEQVEMAIASVSEKIDDRIRRIVREELRTLFAPEDLPPELVEIEEAAGAPEEPVEEPEPEHVEEEFPDPEENGDG